MKILKINKIKVNPNNPRIIKDSKFEKLVQSIKDLPQMLDMRPIIVDENMVILGGNMRYRACKVAGLKEIPVVIYDREAHKKTGQKKTYDEVCEEIIIKDNVGYGEWDWNMLANWDTTKLDEWALPVWQNPDDVLKVNAGDENSEWVGMPEFDEKDKEFKIHIAFETEKDREEFAMKHEMQFSLKSKNVWSAIYPYESRQDLSSLKYE